MIEERIDLPEEFKKEIGSKKMVFGIKQISDALKTGNAEKVLFASNTPKAMLEDLEHFAKLSNIKLERFKGTNEELGVKCKRSHSILVVALLKSK